jgi:transposase
MAYSMDFRRAVAATHEECGSSKDVAEQFGCCQAWVRRVSQRLRETGTLEPRSRARHTDPRSYDDADEQKIRELIAARPDATLREVVAAIGKPVHPTTAGRALARLGLGRKKSPRTPPSGTAPTSPRRGPGGSTSSPTSA